MTMMTMRMMSVPAHEEEDKGDDTEDDDDDSKASEDCGSSGEKVINSQICRLTTTKKELFGIKFSCY